MTIMLDVLLMVIIGGMGTLYGGLIGAAFLKITQTYLPDLQHQIGRASCRERVCHRV